MRKKVVLIMLVCLTFYVAAPLIALADTINESEMNTPELDSVDSAENSVIADEEIKNSDAAETNNIEEKSYKEEMFQSDSMMAKSASTTSDLGATQELAIPNSNELAPQAASDEIVTNEDFDNQDWLINEINRQLTPLKVGVDVTFADLLRIRSIDLSTKGITGQIPEGLIYLQELTRLVLYSNSLSGEIPSFFDKMPNLDYLRLDYNQFTGQIPDGLGHISYLTLQGNQLIGILPASLYEGRTGLNEVNVSGNQVTLNSMNKEPSVYDAYTFIYQGSNYEGQIEATKTYLNLTATDNFKPFSSTDPSFIDLHVIHLFDRNLFPGHTITIEDISSSEVLYEGLITDQISIPLAQWRAGLHSVRFTLDGAFNNPNNQTIIYISIAATPGADVTVQYQDETGQQIAERQVLQGDIGEYYFSSQLSIEGYTFKEIIGEPYGQFSDSPQFVTYVYTKDPVPAGDVTIHYEDESGNSLAEDMVLSGYVGDSYESEALSIADYTLKEIVGNPTGEFTLEAQEVQYIYVKNPISAFGIVTVKYQDESGKKIADELTLTGMIGEAYTTKALMISGYSFKEVNGEPNGEFTAEQQEVVYIYRKTLVNGGEQVKPNPAPPLTEPLPSGILHHQSPESVEAEKILSNQVNLPKAGENSWFLKHSVVLGGGLIIAAILYFYRSKKLAGK